MFSVMNGPFEPALFPNSERVGHNGGLENQIVDDVVRILEYVAEMRVKTDDGLILHYVLHLKRLVIVALRNAAAAGTGKGGCSGSERGGHDALAECIVIRIIKEIPNAKRGKSES